MCFLIMQRFKPRPGSLRHGRPRYQPVAQARACPCSRRELRALSYPALPIAWTITFYCDCKISIYIIEFIRRIVSSEVNGALPSHSQAHQSPKVYLCSGLASPCRVQAVRGARGRVARAPRPGSHLRLTYPCDRSSLVCSVVLICQVELPPDPAGLLATW